jgi:hypothetical protein
MGQIGIGGCLAADLWKPIDRADEAREIVDEF